MTQAVTLGIIDNETKEIILRPVYLPYKFLENGDMETLGAIVWQALRDLKELRDNKSWIIGTGKE